ncbi:hypothetical protein ASD81_01245 [Nocardioides sp. Root614]|nr:hypothetical protein ASD81_01245 [Nocardioides sp. Root614]KRA91349.1 hypothetical protein ASD84_01510 [Nocardioides sp. Root682]
MAVGLLVGFYVLAVAVVGALATGAVLLARSGLDASATGSVVVILFTLGVTVALGRALLLSRGTVGPPPGMAVSETEQPALWQEVRTLAGEIQTRAPDEIRLIAEVNAAVSEDNRFLGLVPGRRRMYVGIPLLLGLSPLEMRSILAHELGHYSARHTALGPVTYRGMMAIGRVARELGHTSVLGRAAGLYGRLYVAVSHSVSRRQELEADAFSARLAGPEAAASAFRMLPPLDVAWDRFTSEYAGLGEDLGMRAQGLLEGFAAMLEDPDVLMRLVGVADAKLPDTVSIYDTHPPLAERVARFDALPAQTPPTTPGSFLVSVPETLASFEESLFEGSDLRPATWSEVAAASGAARARRNRHVLGGLAGSESTLESFTTRISHRGPVGLLQGYPTEDERGILTALLGEAIADVLVQRGSAHFALDWAGPAKLIDADGTRIDLSESLRPLAESGDGGPLRAHLQELEVDIAEPLPIAEEEVPQRPRPPILGAFSTVWASPWSVLLVTPDGMLFAPLTRQERLTLYVRTLAGPGSLTRGSELVLERVLAAPLGELDTDSPLFHAWDAIARAEVSGTSGKVVLHLTNGQRRRLTFNKLSATAGEPWAVVARHLGERWIVR